MCNVLVCYSLIVKFLEVILEFGDICIIFSYLQPMEEVNICDDTVTMIRSSQHSTNDLRASDELSYTFSKYNFSIIISCFVSLDK